MKHVIVVIQTLCLLWATSTWAADVDYARAVAEAQKRNDAAAINRLCNEWAAKAPGDERPRLILGRVLLKAGMLDQAIEQFELAAEANALSPAPKSELGWLFLAQGKLEMAAAELDAALRIDASYTPATLGVARLRLLEGDVEAALSATREVATSTPKSARAQALLGDCLFALGQLEEALAESKRAVALDPQNADAVFGLARVCEAADKQVEAQQHWQRFLDLEPSGTRADAVRNGWVDCGTNVVGSIEEPTGHGVTWSPDGRQLAFGRTARILACISLAEQAPQVRDIATAAGLWYTQPTWSPDGRYVAMLERLEGADYRVVVAPSDGSSAPTRLAPGFGVTWHPAEDHLLYFNAYGTAWGFRSLTLDGASAERHLLVDYIRDAGNRKWRVRQARFGPDGARVVCVASGPDKQVEVFIRSLRQPHNALQLTRNGSSNNVPSLSSDGRSVAYTSNLKGTFDIWVVAADGSAGPVMLVTGTENAVCQAAWSPRGSSLAYRVGKALEVMRLGGLAPSPIRIAAAQTGGKFTVSVSNAGSKPASVKLSYELFDQQSCRTMQGGIGEDDVTLEPDEVIESILDMTDDTANAARVAKVTAVTADGRRVIGLFGINRRHGENGR